MKTVKRIVVVLIIIPVALVAGFYFFSNGNKPQYSGNLSLKDLQMPVEIYFDGIGVPHIYAQNEEDAYLALGYVHAQDRLWQMELVRRIGAGRLSEIFGKDMIEADKLFLGLGIDEAAQESVAKIDTTSKAFVLTKAYLNGINQFMDFGKTPIEFRILGIEKEHYTPKDIYNVFGYMSFGFAQAHKTDLFLTQLQHKLGDAYLQDLDITINPKTTLIQNYTKNNERLFASDLSNSINKIMENLPSPPLMGSNSWVIGAKKTKNNKVIFANDPHIGFAQPSVWYQAHLVTPNSEMYGFHLALNPFPLLGHNHNYAYGLTMLQNDDTDLYTEDPDQNFKVRKETIKVKDSDPVEFEVKIGKNGPVMNGLLKGIDSTRIVTMDWIYTKINNDLLNVSYAISHANSLKDFRQGVSKIHAPGLNVMYGDADNNIAWFGAAQLYHQEENSKLVFEGTALYSEQKELFAFDQNPQAVNPPWGYVYSANNQPNKIGDYLYPGYYLPEDRAKRIVDMLEPKSDFTKEDAQKMILDVQSSVVPGLIRIISENMTKVNFTNQEKEALKVLLEWDGSYKRKSPGPTIYNRFLYNFLEMTFADEMGKESFDHFLTTHLFKRQIAKQIKQRNSIWWDNISTKNIKENRDEIFTNAFHKSIEQLNEQFGEEIEDWTWEKALSVNHKHVFDKVSFLRDYFNVGPFKTEGGNEVINNHIFSLNDRGVYEVYGGPSSRRIIDFSDVEHSLGVIPTGQSGNVFSKHYKNQAENYLNGEFYTMKLNREEIQRTKDKLILNPLKN